MALTNAIWGVPVDTKIAAASTDVQPLIAGERGPHVLILKSALSKLGYERGLDEMELFGPYTHTMVKDFQELYSFPKTGSVGRQTLEALDKLLNGYSLPKNPARSMAAATAAVGADFARRQLPTTKTWVQNCIDKASAAYDDFRLDREVAFDTSMALLFHFRIITTTFTQIYSLSIGSGSDIFLDGLEPANRSKVLDKLRAIKSTYSSMMGIMSSKNGTNFVDYVPPPAPAPDPNFKLIAWADIPGQKIIFHPRLFFAATATNPAGKDLRSGSWVVIHELGHLVIGEASLHELIEGTCIPRNAYSSKPQYYLDDADKCVKNPDCYVHFAYQIVFGAPNVGPY